MGNTPSWQTNPRLICRCSRQCHCLIKYILKQIFKNISFINFEDKSPGLRRYAYMYIGDIDHLYGFPKNPKYKSVELGNQLD